MIGGVVRNVILDSSLFDSTEWATMLGNIGQGEITQNLLARTGKIALRWRDSEGWAGINNTKLHKNVIIDDPRALDLTNLEFNDVAIAGNLFAAPEVFHDRDGAMDAIDYADNMTESTASISSIADYHAMIGGTPSLEAFLLEPRHQSRRYWRTEYQPEAVNRYFLADARLSD